MAHAVDQMPGPLHLIPAYVLQSQADIKAIHPCIIETEAGFYYAVC